jgi:hypothetical protein
MLWGLSGSETTTPASEVPPYVPLCRAPTGATRLLPSDLAAFVLLDQPHIGSDSLIFMGSGRMPTTIGAELDLQIRCFRPRTMGWAFVGVGRRW